MYNLVSSRWAVTLMAGLPLIGVIGHALADTFERQPLTRPSTKPIALSQDWTKSAESSGGLDRHPSIVLVDAVKGRYALRWIGHDGQKKEITYYEPDRIDVIVRAAVSSGAAHKYRYQYEVTSRRTSGQDVFGIAIQTFGGDVRAVAPSDGRFIGQMTKLAPEFSAGMWYRVPFEARELPPGAVQRVALESDAPPGLVQVRAHGGPLGMKGVGEEPPEVLEASLPRYEVWPLGVTIGPVADVSNEEYAFGRQDLSELIGLMADAGWVSRETGARYEQLIKGDLYAELQSAIDEDVNRKNAAPEAAFALNRIAIEQKAAAAKKIGSPAK